jgi:hypothetical protein
MTNFTFFTVVQKVVAQGSILGGASIILTMRMTANNLGFTSDDGTSTLTLASGTSVVTAPAIFAITGNAATSTRNLYKNSATIGISGAYDGNITPNFFGAALGGARGGFNMGETIIYKSVLSADEIATIMRYLANKWGVILT